MRRPVLACLTPSAVLLAVACTDATGSISGGQALTACAPGAGGSTFSDLYADFFGPCGKASCTGQSSCHGGASQVGAQTSGFVCGSSKDACWQGMTQGIAPDAGGFFCPIVCLGTCAQTGQPCPADPTQTQFWLGIHKAGATSGLNNMPCGGPPTCPSASSTYTFTDDDLARISAWIAAGAQND